MINTIGIVGQGFVGGALNEGMKHAFNIETYDKFVSEKSTCNSLESLVEKADVIFVCLPTPMRKDGSCDLRIVERAILDIDQICSENEYLGKISVIKSTIPPGTTESLNNKVKYIQVVFNPEFLTEANAVDDFKNQTRIIVGGPRPGSSVVKNVFRKAFKQTPIIKTGSNTAEMVKYFTNCFLSTKVSFCNEIKQICDPLGIDYDKIVEYALYDNRLGKSHWSVPGPDGSMGFGGHCFPKDLNALMYVARSLGVDPMVMAGVWDKNLEVRTDAARDWEKMSGRAVSED
jgi:UDPglucose 6-dehydrogenase